MTDKKVYEAVKKWFKENPPPPAPVELSPGVKIIDMKLFLESHLKVIKLRGPYCMEFTHMKELKDWMIKHGKTNDKG